MHYNNLTQCLLVLSYNSVIQVYRIESGLFDVDLLSQLRGHKSIVTCIDSVATSSLVVTGDDIGEVRIWELNYMRCLQVVSIAKSFRSLAFIGDRLLFSDGRINILQLDHQGSCKTEHLSGLYQHIDELQGLLWIVTSKDIRKL